MRKIWMWFYRRFICRHWWKGMMDCDSAYWYYFGTRVYIDYQASECKRCGHIKIERTNI